MGGERGSFLVLTTWLLAILALLALGVSARGQYELRVAAYERDTAQVQLATWAGVERIMELVGQDDASHDGYNDAWASNPAALQDQSVMAGRTSFTVLHTVETSPGRTRTLYGADDEQARLNVNTATPEMIAALPGMNLDIARAIVAFRDPVAQHPDDAYYTTLTPPYQRKRAAFESLAELGLVRGMTPELFQIVSRFCTVYPKDGAVNVNTAPREVLVAIGLSPALVESISSYRLGADGAPGTEDDGVFSAVSLTAGQDGKHSWILPDGTTWIIEPNDAAILANQQRITVRSTALRLHVEGRLADGTVTRALEAVILRPGNNEAPKIVAWEWQ